jgi:hypothetical protein
MSEEFSAITFQALVGGGWVDISADVLHNPSPKWNMGIMGNDTLDRVGDPEELAFALDNSANNSAGILGYWSPTNPNCRTGWGPGVAVRLLFTYEGGTYYKFYGLIAPDGLETEGGLYAGRRVSVRVEGFMALAARHVLELMSLRTNITITDAVPYLLNNMPIQPLATSYGTGVDTFATMFDTISENTSALSELRKIAMSEFGYVYTKGDGTGGQTLVVEGRSDRTNKENTLVPLELALSTSALLLETGDHLLLETGDKLLLNETQTANFSDEQISIKTEYGANLANRISGTSYPRQVDAAATTVLFVTQTRIYVTAGQTKSNIRGRYRDPAGAANYVNGQNMVTPVSGTDFIATANSDGTGTDYTANCTVAATYGTEQVDYTIINTGAAAFYVWLQARGKGIYLYDPINVIFEDTTSIYLYGLFPLTLSMPYQNNPLAVESVGNLVLSNNKDPKLTVNSYTINANRNAKSMFAFLALEPGTRSRFAETVTGTDANYFINGYSAEIVAGHIVNWSPVLKIADDTDFWIMDTSDLDTGTILDT